jgi:penicillin amidase
MTLHHRLRKKAQKGFLRSPRLPQFAWGKLLLAICDGILIVCILAAAFVVIFFRASLPQTAGKLVVHGLQHPVAVERDQWGVPSISATTMHDLLFAQGYVTAQDRLFQMELDRRITQGRLAELFGTGADDQLLDTDMLLRTLSIYRAIEVQLKHVNPQTRTALQVYTDGVNAFISTHTQALPLEFRLLGITPAPWTLADSVAVTANIVLALDSTWYTKYTRALVEAKVGPQTTEQLFPSYPAQNPTLLPSMAAQAAPASVTSVVQAMSTIGQHSNMSDLDGAVATLHTLLGNVNGSLGSNSWVVDGSRTTTGKPLLANDPHLDIQMPATWYEIALHCGQFNVIGASLPGAPGVIIGHNSAIAWGITSVNADTTDLYTETLDTLHHPGEYLYNHQWYPLSVRQEVIFVRGQSRPVVITVTSTRHGPLLNSVVGDLKDVMPIALKWTLLQPEYQLSNFLQLDAASNWPQFQEALTTFSMCLNFVYADVQGNIGYQMSGLLPIRENANHVLPVNGADSHYEWHGYVPQQRLPTLFNPASHEIVVANNQIVPQNSSLYVTAYWDQGYRARRITDLLAEHTLLSRADFAHIQADVYSIPAALLTPYLIAAGRSSHDANVAMATNLLQHWNDKVTSDSVAASIYEVTTSILLRQIGEGLLGKSLYNLYQENTDTTDLLTFLINAMQYPQASIFGSRQSSAAAGRDALIRAALSTAVHQLQIQYSINPQQWQWGHLHQARFLHPLADVGPLSLIFGTPSLQRPGDDTTIDIGGNDGAAADPPIYSQMTVASMREIIDLAHFDDSLWVITTGESGQPLSLHYDDLNLLWNQDEYQQMIFSKLGEKTPSSDYLQLLP